LPGGHIEAGETFEAAVVREVHEETGITARVVCGLGAVPVTREGFTYAIHEHLLVPLDAAEPVARDDAEDARWVARDALVAMGVRPDALAVIDLGVTEARARRLLP
jgi:8-oxo-dGTP pyrophosphatase MutT (NUDIX family)